MKLKRIRDRTLVSIPWLEFRELLLGIPRFWYGEHSGRIVLIQVGGEVWAVGDISPTEENACQSGGDVVPF